MSGCILQLSFSHSPVFLLNSCLDLFSAPRFHEDPFSRSYGVNLPSSLTMNLSSASVFSTRPRVSVSSTGASSLWLRGFSREHGYLRFPLARRLAVLSGSAQSGDLPPPLYTYTLQRAIPSARGSVTSPSLRRSWASHGIFTVSSIWFSFRMPIRSRLTLIRLAWIRNPWSYGEGVSRPLYRYLYLHLLFRLLHNGSNLCFAAAGMLPYQLTVAVNSTSSAPDLCPIIIHAAPLD